MAPGSTDMTGANPALPRTGSRVGGSPSSAGGRSEIPTVELPFYQELPIRNIVSARLGVVWTLAGLSR